MPSEIQPEDNSVQPSVPDERVCRHCGDSFAPEESSPLDDNLCGKCLKISDLHSAPLTDDEGVTHKGRIIQFIAGLYVSPLKQISEMSDIELEQFIVEYTQEVHLLETKTDHARIKLAAAEFEKGERKSHKARRRIKLLDASGNAVDHKATLRKKLSDSRKRSDANSALKELGIDPTKIAEILAGLKK